MTDPHDEFDLETGRRRTTGPVWIGVGALLIGATSVAIWYTALRTSGEGSRVPQPGPSASPERDRQAPLPIALVNGTDTEHLEEYVAAMLRGAGRLIRPDSGYEIQEGSPQEPQETSHRISKMFFAPARRDATLNLRHQMFPRARLRPALPGEEDLVRVIIGEDFLRYWEDELQAFPFVRAFMDRRLEGSGAERFLSEQALASYSRGRGGLSLYGYTAQPGATFQIIGWSFETLMVGIETEGSGHHYEMLGVVQGTEGSQRQLLISGAGPMPDRFLRFLGVDSEG